MRRTKNAAGAAGTYLRLLVGLLVVLSFAARASAEEGRMPASSPPPARGQVNMKIQVVGLTQQAAGEIWGRDTLPAGTLERLMGEGKAVELAGQRFSVLNGQKFDSFMGSRYPVTDFDVKAGRYRVRYIGTGITFSLLPSVTGENLLDLSVEYEISDDDVKGGTDKTLSSRVSRALSGLRSGETAVITETYGVLTRYLLENYQNEKLLTLAAKYLVVAVTPVFAPADAAASPAGGGATPASLELRILQLAGSASRRCSQVYAFSEDLLSSLLASGQATLLELQHLSSPGKGVFLMIGKKYPMKCPVMVPGVMTFPDEIIYIDVGLKADIQCTSVGPRRWRIRADTELAEISPNQGAVQSAIASDTCLELNSGESGVLLGLRGAICRRLIGNGIFAYPTALNFTSDDELFILVTPR